MFKIPMTIKPRPATHSFINVTNKFYYLTRKQLANASLTQCHSIYVKNINSTLLFSVFLTYMHHV